MFCGLDFFFLLFSKDFVFNVFIKCAHTGLYKTPLAVVCAKNIIRERVMYCLNYRRTHRYGFVYSFVYSYILILYAVKKNPLTGVNYFLLKKKKSTTFIIIFFFLHWYKYYYFAWSDVILFYLYIKFAIFFLFFQCLRRRSSNHINSIQ